MQCTIHNTSRLPINCIRRFFQCSGYWRPTFIPRPVLESSCKAGKTLRSMQCVTCYAWHVIWHVYYVIFNIIKDESYNKYVNRYSWIADQRDAHEKLTCRRTRKVTTILRPPLESSPRGEFRSIRTTFWLGIILKVILNDFQNNA